MAAIFPEFELIDKSLDQVAEVHGLLCGLLCADESLNVDDWLQQIGHEMDQGSVRDLLLQIFAITVSQINDEDMGFTLLLPSDHAPLWKRTESLAQWCQGLLGGLGLGGLSHQQSSDVREFLQDLGRIAQVGFDGSNEENEKAYTEIVELLVVLKKCG